MPHFSQRSLVPGLMIAMGTAIGAIVALALPSSTPAAAPNARFSDTEGYWAQPFIQPLADQNIVAGYLDGTFRPNQPMARDEFAAIVRSAFDPKPKEQTTDSSTYKDVPKSSWAVPAIEEARDLGFVQGYPDGTFRPQKAIRKAEAISVLADNLNLPSASSTEPVATAPSPAAAPSPTAAPSATNTQPARPQANKRRAFMYPMAMTTLMQPLMSLSRQVQTASAAPAQNAQPTAITPAAVPQPPQKPAAVSEYYADADQIPQETVGNIAAATRAGIVVNYPDPKVLNPNQDATRGEVAAWIYQALVSQGRMPSLANNPAEAYVVTPR